MNILRVDLHFRCVSLSPKTDLSIYKDSYCCEEAVREKERKRDTLQGGAGAVLRGEDLQRDGNVRLGEKPFK